AETAARGGRTRTQGGKTRAAQAETGSTRRSTASRPPVARLLLRRLDAMNDHRRTLAARYTTGLAGLPLGLPAETPGARHVYHLYVVRTPRRAELGAFLKDKGIATGIHYPVASHQQPAGAYLQPRVLAHTPPLRNP